ncbi:lorien protein [Trypanosoma grayi]|uniref:lorien protein n=1 Tax=Trypanosoma grayi TaxID=71804 RepID=UPI0004F49990|nr:lorien protein [Trypanosoma grayi]KEG15476.1 lorien protein [Trypanosoma grayi]
MKYPPGSPVWVRCDDGEWWPAVVREANKESFLEVGGEYDMCVEFYHDRENLYPVASGDNGVRQFHVLEAERDNEERGLFLVEVTKKAVQQALLDSGRSAPPLDIIQTYSAAELRCMSALLGTVNHDTASQLRQALLKNEGIDLSSKNVKKIAEKERRKRKRTIPSAEVTMPRVLSGVTPPLPPPPPPTRSSYINSPAPPAVPPLSASQPVAVMTAKIERKFQEPFDSAALDVLRKEVFENKERYVLSPLYRYLEVLGAVVVDGDPVETTLPSPLALHEVPDGGFPPSRRVLLVALSTPTFDHTDGWMMPFEYEGATVAMTLAVNGAVVEIPSNPSLPSGKETMAVKTAPAADITSLVLREELFSLAVDFTGFIEDTTLWGGVIAAVYVDTVDMDVLADRVVSNYQVPPRRKERVDVVGVHVKIVCPLTTLPLKVPVRGFLCEHMQCMELCSLLTHCARTNVWNCPLCWAPTRPQTIMVNYRLKEWLERYHTLLSKVDYVVETPSGEPLRAIWKRESRRQVADVIAVE